MVIQLVPHQKHFHQAWRVAAAPAHAGGNLELAGRPDPRHIPCADASHRPGAGGMPGLGDIIRTLAQILAPGNLGKVTVDLAYGDGPAGRVLDSLLG